MFVSFRRAFRLSLLLVFAFALMGRADDDAERRKQLAGEWKGYTVNGKGENPDDGPVRVELVITDKTISGVTFQNKQQMDQGEGEYTLNLSTTPHTLDGAKPRPNGRKQEWLGIYTLDGDTLMWCVGRQRPATFETVKGQFLLILKREKSEQ